MNRNRKKLEMIRPAVIFPVIVFLTVCFSCNKNPVQGGNETGEVMVPEQPYTWEQVQDTWKITLQRDHSFPLNEPWSLYLYYSWTGKEEDIPLELNVHGTYYDFFPKVIIDELSTGSHRFTETFVVFHSEQWKNLPLEITIKINQSADFSVTDVILVPRSSGTCPLAADPGTMMHYPPSCWRTQPWLGAGSYEVFSHNLYPSLLYVICDTYETQSLFLRRLAFFTEKAGFVGRLASDEEIADLRDWFAHDYRAGDLAAFYDLARRELFPLNDNELILRNLLLEHGIIRYEGGVYVEGEGALLGFTAESADRLFVYFVHETVHGLEFTIPELQTIFMDFFDSLSWIEKTFLRDAFLFRDYNVIEDKQLFATEMAAYLLQQRPEETDKYFKEYILYWYLAYHWKPEVDSPEADSLEETDKAPAPYSDNVTVFLAANPEIFGRRCAALQKDFYALTGLVAENFYDLLPKGNWILPKEPNL